jgi:hypothetical protein
VLKRLYKATFVLLLFLCPLSSRAEAQGIVCDGTTDNAPYLNSLKLTRNNLTLTPGCVVALKSTWNIKNQQSFTIDGQARCGLPAACPRLKWLGPAGGTILNMENVQGVLVENLGFDGAGLAANGVIVDEISPVVVNTYDVIFQGDEFDGNYPGSGAPNQNWVGLSVSPVSRADVADIRVVDSSFACRGTGPGSGTIGYAQGLVKHSQNSLQNVIRHDNFTACGYGIYQNSGGAIIEENTFGGDANTIDDIFVSGSTAGQERIARNWSETQYGTNNQFLRIDTPPGASLEISANQIPVNLGCAVDIGGNAITSTQANQWYPGANCGGTWTGCKGTKVCSTGNSSAGFTWSGPSGLAWSGTTAGDLSGKGIPNGIFLPGSIENGPSAGLRTISAGAIPTGAPVKWTGTSTASGTQSTDAGQNLVVGVAANSPGTSGRSVYVMTSGWIMMAADGNCAVGQSVQVSPRTNFHVVCTSAPHAGTIIGKVLRGETGDGSVYVQVNLSDVWTFVK